MRLLFLIITILIMAGLLSGCGSIVKPKYTYIPPQTAADKICVARCSKGKNYCRDICQLKDESCKARAYRTALYRYEMYKRDRQHNRMKVQNNIYDFYNGRACHVSCDCTTSYNTCYAACGGQVQEKFF